MSEITRLHVKFASPSLVTKKLKSSNRIDQFTRQSILRLIVITFTSNINNSVLLKPIKRRLYSYLAHRLSLVNSDILSKAKWNRLCQSCFKRSWELRMGRDSEVSAILVIKPSCKKWSKIFLEALISVSAFGANISANSHPWMHSNAGSSGDFNSVVTGYIF